MKFPFKLCKDDHLTHLFPKIEEASRILSKSSIVLTNSFPHYQHMALGPPNTKNASRGSQNSLTHEGGHLCVNMVKSQIDVATRSCDYIYLETVVGLESPPPLEIPLHIENMEPLPCIMKGVLK
jgi:hypothetical protein